MSTLSLIRLTTSTDGLVTGTLSNFDYKLVPHPYNTVMLQAVPNMHTFPENNCTCFGATMCAIPAFISFDG